LGLDKRAQKWQNYIIMPKEDPKKAAKALILSNGKYLLLLRSAEEDICPSDWDIPGGGIEPGETEQGAMVREIKEETGIDLSSCRAIPIKRWEGLNKNGVKISGIDFLCILDSRPDVVLSPEHVEARWLSKEEILEGEEFAEWVKESVKLASEALNNNQS